MFAAIVAIGHNGEFGIGDTIPWMGKVPRDMRHFKSVSSAYSVVMGRKTADTLKLPLSGRNCIVVSSKPYTILKRNLKKGGDEMMSTVGSLQEALDLSWPWRDKQPILIGGASLISQALSEGLIKKLYLTTIHGNFEADTFLKVDTSGFDLIHQEHHAPDEENAYGCTFEKYLKKETT